MIELKDVAAALSRYANRYRFLDILAADLRLDGAVEWRLSNGKYVTNSTVPPLQAENLANGVIRFSLAPSVIDQFGPAAAGAAVGAALGSQSKESGSVLAGMLLGMLVGAVAGEGLRMNRVMALRFEPAEGRWNIYDGPMLNLAKAQLVPSG